MRYKTTENAWLLGNLPAGQNVSIKIINLDTDELQNLTDNTCIESSVISGLYKFNIEDNMTLPTQYTNFAYEMTDGDNIFRGKFVYGDFVDEAKLLLDFRNELINVTFGGLEIKDNQLIITDKQGVVLSIFDLFDCAGNPTMKSIFKRVVVQ